MSSNTTRSTIPCRDCKAPVPVKRDPVLLRELPTQDLCPKCQESHEQGWRDFMSDEEDAV